MQCTVATLTLTSSLSVSCNRYLTLIEGAESYAVLRDSSRTVVSLPPVTNCDKSKVKTPSGHTYNIGVHLVKVPSVCFLVCCVQMMRRGTPLESFLLIPF